MQDVCIVQLAIELSRIAARDDSLTNPFAMPLAEGVMQTSALGT